MSASDKKKLRKEQQNAALTEKQLAEQKQQKKQKAYTLTFIIAMVLVVAIVLVSVLQAPVTTLLMRGANSLTVNGHEIDAVEFNYFYMDTINQFYSQFSDGGDYQDLYVQIYTGLNPAQSLDSQTYNQETGETWADYFTDSAIASAKWTYTMYDAAQAAGYKLSESEQRSLDSIETTYEQIAKLYYGLNSANGYLKSLYGSSANMKSYMEYYTVSTIATSYASSYIEGLEFEDKDFREFEKDKMEEYNSYSYAYFYLNYNSYLTGGTTEKDENGKDVVTYSEEEKEAARALALEDAKKLAVAENSTVEKLNEAIKALEHKGTTTEATESTAVLFSNLPSIEGMADWLSDSERKAGDITYIAYTTHTHAEGEEHSDDEDESAHETVNGYYVVLYLDTVDNNVNIGTVRHLLVQFKNADGKTYSDGIKTFTEEQKNTAKEKAEKLLAEFEAGEKTEEAFTELAKKNSDDSGSKTSGGLITNIHPDSGYVKAFTDWATADHEKGDYEIVETEHGYHIMYYVEAEELNYRDTLINNDLIDEAYTAWEEALLEKATVSEGNLNSVDTDLIISQ